MEPLCYSPLLLRYRLLLKLHCMEGGDNVGIRFQFAVSWLLVTCCGGHLVLINCLPLIILGVTSGVTSATERGLLTGGQCFVESQRNLWTNWQY